MSEMDSLEVQAKGPDTQKGKYMTFRSGQEFFGL